MTKLVLIAKIKYSIPCYFVEFIINKAVYSTILYAPSFTPFTTSLSLLFIVSVYSYFRMTQSVMIWLMANIQVIYSETNATHA